MAAKKQNGCKKNKMAAKKQNGCISLDRFNKYNFL